MSRLTTLLTLVTSVVIGTTSVSVAQPVVRGDVQVHVDLPKVIIRDRDRSPPRGYIRYDDYDARYDRIDRSRSAYDVTGTYDSQYGRVYLTQDGNRVTGTYDTGGGGVIKGRIRNGVLYYRWRQAGSEGHGMWYLNRRGGQLAGSWGTFESANNAGAWNLQRVGVSRNDRFDRRYRR